MSLHEHTVRFHDYLGSLARAALTVILKKAKGDGKIADFEVNGEHMFTITPLPELQCLKVELVTNVYIRPCVRERVVLKGHEGRGPLEIIGVVVNGPEMGRFQVEGLPRSHFDIGDIVKRIAPGDVLATRLQNVTRIKKSER